eukprot:13609822-Alexandrium_andersonii.AAC.1
MAPMGTYDWVNLRALRRPFPAMAPGSAQTKYRREIRRTGVSDVPRLDSHRFRFWCSSSSRIHDQQALHHSSISKWRDAECSFALISLPRLDAPRLPT